MTFVGFLIIILLTVLLAAGAIWLLNQIYTPRPAIIDKLIWILVVVIIVASLLQATGIWAYLQKVMIPHV